MTTETETRAFAQQFTPETRRGFSGIGASLIKSKERTLYDFEKEGRKFVTLFLTQEQRDKIFSVRSRPTEIAYLPSSLFFFGDLRHDSFQDQIKMIDILKTDLNNAGIKDVDVIFPSVADCMEIYEAELQSVRPTNIFGRRNGYPLVRTSTKLDSDSTVIIGCDDSDIPKDFFNRGPIGEFRGIHVQDFPKDSNMHSGLYLMPIFVPTF